MLSTAVCNTHTRLAIGSVKSIARQRPIRSMRLDLLVSEFTVSTRERGGTVLIEIYAFVFADSSHL